MNYIERKCDLFTLDQTKFVLAHCISSDVTATKNMNKGIAKLFRNKYPNMATFIERNMQIGKSIRYKENNHVIYNMVSKQWVSQKACGEYSSNYYENLRNALEDLKEQMLKNGETNLGIPRIACGLDNGDWKIVQNLIKNIFGNTNIDIIMCYIED